MRKLKIKLQIAQFFKKIYWSGLILVLRILTSVLINSYIGLTKICLNFGILRGVYKYSFSKIYDFLVWVKNKNGTVPVTEYYRPTGYLQYNLEVEPEVIGKKRHFYYFITDWFLSTGARIIGTVMSLFIRINLTIPGDALFLGNIQLYNVIITGHAVIMIFFLVIPALIGDFGNWFVPLIIGPFLFLGAFGIFETLMAVLQSFVPAQIWVKLYLFAQKVWAGFFLLTTLCCKKIVIFIKQPRNVLQKSTILIFITEYAAELIMFIAGWILLYVVIKIIDLLIKEKPNLKYWYTRVITALNWVIVILLISYIIVNLLFIIFPMQVNKTILTIGSILSLCTLWLAISNLFFLINKYKDRFSDQNRFFMAIFYMCQLIIKVLYKTKLIDKMFYLVCFQFFNTNQKTADLCNVISFILCLIYIFLLRTVMQFLRIAFSYEEYDYYSPNQLFVIWILFLAGFTGFLFRLCVNFSYKVVPFTFLYFPIYYNIIIDRTNTVNKPQINFYYQRIPTKNWFFLSLLGLRLGGVLFLSVILHGCYKVYLKKWELREYVESLNCNKILTDLEKVLPTFTGPEERLKGLLELKAVCEAKLHPEDAEIIFKDDPNGLKEFRYYYPKNTTMKEQPLIKDTENLDILAWAQANVNFIVIGIIILLVVVYFVKKNKPKIKEREIVKKNAFFGELSGLAMCSKKIVSYVKQPSYTYNTTVLSMMITYDIIILVCYGVILYIIIKIIDIKGKEIKEIYNYWFPLIRTAINWILIILIIIYVIVNLIFIILPIKATTTLFAISGFLGIITLLVAHCNTFFIINSYKDKFADNNIFFILTFKMCKRIINFLYKLKLLDKMFHLVYFQFFNKNPKVADLVNVISLLLCLLAVTIIRIGMMELRDAVRSHDDTLFSENVIFVLWILFLAGFCGGVYRLLVNVSFRLVPFTFLYFPLYYKNIMARNIFINKPTIDFYYPRILKMRWFACGLLIIRFGLLAITFYYLYYAHRIKSQIAKNELDRIEWRKELDSYTDTFLEETIETIEQQIRNHKGSFKDLELLNRVKRFVQAQLHPEDAEIIFKDDPKGLKEFRYYYPKNTTMQEQPLSNAPEVFEKFDILAWAQANVSFIVIGIIILLVVVYFVKKNKKNVSNNEKQTKNISFILFVCFVNPNIILNNLMYLALGLFMFVLIFRTTKVEKKAVKQNNFGWITAIIAFFENVQNQLLIMLFLLGGCICLYIIKDVPSLKDAFQIGSSWILKSKKALVIILKLLLFFEIIFIIIFGMFSFWMPINIKLILFTAGKFLFLLTMIPASINIYFSIDSLKNTNFVKDKLFTKFPFLQNKFFPYIFKKCLAFIYFLYDKKLLKHIYSIYVFQFLRPQSLDQNISSGILLVIYLQILRIVLRMFDGFFKNMIINIDINAYMLFFIWIFYVIGFLGTYYRTLINTSVKIVIFVNQNCSTFHKEMCALHNINLSDIPEENIKDWFALGKFCLLFSALLFVLFLFVFIYYF